MKPIKDWSSWAIAFGSLFFLVFGIATTSDLDKPDIIHWDGYGYYLYLPENYIYSDQDKYEFVEEHGEKYPGSYEGYQLLQTPSGSYRPIYNIGLSIIWAPFFGLGHLLTQLTGHHDADGMSSYYQWAIYLCAILYYFLGMVFLRRWLRFYLKDRIVALVILMISFATNYFYYFNFGKELTHIYLFTWLAYFLYNVDLYYRLRAQKYFWLASLSLGVAVLVRSSEILWIILPFFYGLKLNQKQNWKRLSQENLKNCLIMLFAASLIYVGGQMLYDYATTGQFFIDGYGEHGFDFLHPGFTKQLFGYNRGWFFYTPILFFGVGGIYLMYKKSNIWFLSTLLFMLVYVWMVSSWDVWTYGSTFGNRPLLQTLALMALPMGFATRWAFAQKKWLRLLFALALVFFVFHNLFQTYQYQKSVLPRNLISWEYYKAVFFKSHVDQKTKILNQYPDALDYRNYNNWTSIVEVDSPRMIPSKAGNDNSEYTVLREFYNYELPQKLGPEALLAFHLELSYYGDDFIYDTAPIFVLEAYSGDSMLLWKGFKLPEYMQHREWDSLDFSTPLSGINDSSRFKLLIINNTADSMLIHKWNMRIADEE